MSRVAPVASGDVAPVPGDSPASWGLAAVLAGGRRRGSACCATDERESGEAGWAGAGPEGECNRGLLPWSKERRPFPVGVLPCARTNDSSSCCNAAIAPGHKGPHSLCRQCRTGLEYAQVCACVYSRARQDSIAECSMSVPPALHCLCAPHGGTSSPTSKPP